MGRAVDVIVAPYYAVVVDVADRNRVNTNRKQLLLLLLARDEVG